MVSRLPIIVLIGPNIISIFYCFKGRKKKENRKKKKKMEKIEKKEKNEERRKDIFTTKETNEADRCNR